MKILIISLRFVFLFVLFCGFFVCIYQNSKTINPYSDQCKRVDDFEVVWTFGYGCWGVYTDFVKENLFKDDLSGYVLVVPSCGTGSTYYEIDFSSWKELQIINLRDLDKIAAPLVNLGYRGDFDFSHIKYEESDVIRISPVAKSKDGGLEIQFGYYLNQNGFNLNLIPNQEVVFTVSARRSDGIKSPTKLFIQDKAEGWERKSTIMDKINWGQYRVLKKINYGAKVVCFGINWLPQNKNEWLEIKDVRAYVVSGTGQMSSVFKDMFLLYTFFPMKVEIRDAVTLSIDEVTYRKLMKYPAIKKSYKEEDDNIEINYYLIKGLKARDYNTWALYFYQKDKVVNIFTLPLNWEVLDETN